MQFLLNIFNNAFPRYLILRVSHCQGNSQGSREEPWKCISYASSQEQLEVALTGPLEFWPLAAAGVVQVWTGAEMQQSSQAEKGKRKLKRVGTGEKSLVKCTFDQMVQS